MALLCLYHLQSLLHPYPRQDPLPRILVKSDDTFNIHTLFPGMSMKPKIKSFFGASRQYVVAGASNNPSKFGFKILLWYVSHGLSVIPINPKESEILGQPVVKSIPEVLKSLSAGKDINQYKLSSADGLSVSFLTPPHITVQTLKDIAEVPEYKSLIRGLWFQPGSYDQEALDTAEALGLLEKVVHQEECILIRGEEGMYSANL